MGKQRREERKAADQAEYKDSLRRAAQAAEEQRQQPGEGAGLMWLVAPSVALAMNIATEKRREDQTAAPPTPPPSRPDLKE